MRVFVTGAAGFIGMHVAQRLHDGGCTVAGLDNFNDYYDPALKRARAAQIRAFCPVAEVDLADAAATRRTIVDFAPDVVVHLAAQAGVRHSLEAPMAYVQSNLVGHAAVLEACRALEGRLSHLVYASSSSVYGAASGPSAETAAADLPVSLYAATKRADELISSAYAHLYGLRQVGLRFFTVYGPWGRPDMAYWSFTERILTGRPIRIFNGGDMKRDFTWIGDVADGVAAVARRAPAFAPGERSHRLYNIGAGRPEPLLDMVAALERAAGRPAIREFAPMQPGDVAETFADIAAIRRDYGYSPTTRIAQGLPAFVAWFRDRSGL